jgi:hypothetical protein
MKRIFFVLALVLPAIMILSCASEKPAEVQPPVEEPAPPPPEEYSPEPTVEEVYEKYSGDIILEDAKTHRVRRGEDLSKVARRYYGGVNGYYFPLILLASRDVAKDPDLIMPGTTLTIPDLNRNLNDPGARQRLKEFLYEVADVYSTRLRKKWGPESRDQLRALASSL